MIAAVLQEKNQALSLVNVPDLTPITSESLIKNHFAALNHRDYWIIQGKYAGIKYPIILGSDLCGEIGSRKVIVNPGFSWGDDERYQAKQFNILGLPKDGSLAEFVSIHNEYIYDKPAYLSDAEAAALPLAGITAYRAIFTRGDAKPKQKIFITGIGGGVALFILQFALAHQMQVYVSSSSDEKIQKAIELGAVGGINYKQNEWDKNFLAAHGEMDLIIDSAAGPDFSKLVKLTKPGGNIVIYGGSAGEINGLIAQQIFWKQINIKGSTMGSSQDFRNMLDFVQLHKIIPIIDSIFPLSNINGAFDRMSNGQQFGKIVIDICA